MRADQELGEGRGVAGFASRLNVELDSVVGSPTWSMSAAEHAETLLALTRAQDRLELLRLRVLASAETIGLGSDEGAPDAGVWLAQEARVTRATASRDRSLALDLDNGGFTALSEALAAGKLRVEQARVVIDSVNRLPDELCYDVRRQAEKHLVDLAGVHDAKALRILGRHLLEVVAPEIAEQADARALASEERYARAHTSLHMYDDGTGCSRGRFCIPTRHAAMLRKALLALTSPRRLSAAEQDRDLTVTPDRLGRGLLEYIERYPADALPHAGGVSATVVVMMTLDSLLGGLRAASIDTGEQMSADEARRLACSAGIIPVVLGGASQVLDLGRRRRLHTESQRVALTLRDGGCTADGCDRPAAMCEAHHDRPWSRGGGTSLRNARLLCSRHHHLAHDPQYRT